jgi:hypothetical protein
MAGGCEVHSQAFCQAGEMHNGTGVSIERDASVRKQWRLFEIEMLVVKVQKQENGKIIWV